MAPDRGSRRGDAGAGAQGDLLVLHRAREALDEDVVAASAPRPSRLTAISASFGAAMEPVLVSCGPPVRGPGQALVGARHRGRPGSAREGPRAPAPASTWSGAGPIASTPMRLMNAATCRRPTSWPSPFSGSFEPPAACERMLRVQLTSRRISARSACEVRRRRPGRCPGRSRGISRADRRTARGRGRSSPCGPRRRTGLAERALHEPLASVSVSVSVNVRSSRAGPSRPPPGAPAAGAGPRMPDAPSRSGARPCAIRSAWTSHRGARSAGVRSPSTATRGTRASRGGRWLRPGRLVTVVPRRRHRADLARIAHPATPSGSPSHLCGRWRSAALRSAPASTPLAAAWTDRHGRAGRSDSRPRTTAPHPEREAWPYPARGTWSSIGRTGTGRAELTAVPMPRGCLHLLAVMNWAARHRSSPGGCRTPWTPITCVEALADAPDRHGRAGVFDTDRGCQSTDPRFTDVLRDADARPSPDGRGRWMDDVVAAPRGPPGHRAPPAQGDARAHLPPRLRDRPGGPRRIGRWASPPTPRGSARSSVAEPRRGPSRPLGHQRAGTTMTRTTRGDAATLCAVPGSAAAPRSSVLPISVRAWRHRGATAGWSRVPSSMAPSTANAA